MNNKYSEGYPGQRYGAGLRPTNPNPGRVGEEPPILPGLTSGKDAVSLCWQPGSSRTGCDLLSLCPWPHVGQSQQGHICCGCTEGPSPQCVPSLVTGPVLSPEFGFSPALSCPAGTTAGRSLWMSWRGCARSEPCRLTGSTPRSGESTSSPTQVLGGSGEPGQFSQAPVCSSIHNQPGALSLQGHLQTLRCTRPWWSPTAGSWGWTCPTVATSPTAS